MLYSNLLTRKSAVFSILCSVALASPAPQNAATGTLLGPGAVPAAAATAMPTCLGVGASVIPPLGPGPNPGAADNMGFDSGSDGSGDSSATARRDLLLGEMNNFLYERQDGSMGASDGFMGASDGSTGASDPTAMTGGPIQIPPNTTYCGWLGGMGMQSDMLLFNPGTYQLTWQNVTGDGRKYSPALSSIEHCVSSFPPLSHPLPHPSMREREKSRTSLFEFIDAHNHIIEDLLLS